MKKITIAVAILLTASLANAQKIADKEVPSAVKEALQKQYPAAKKVKWDKEQANYEAGFEATGTEYSVLLDSKGAILETEVEIKIDAMPAKIKEYVSKKYPGEKIKEAAKITNSKGIVTFEAEVKGKDLIFDNTGNFLKEETAG
ncbi:MAG: PepSY-like domain-containing protein [Lacibacter sp.]